MPHPPCVHPPHVLDGENPAEPMLDSTGGQSVEYCFKTQLEAWMMENKSLITQVLARQARVENQLTQLVSQSMTRPARDVSSTSSTDQCSVDKVGRVCSASTQHPLPSLMQSTIIDWPSQENKGAQSQGVTSGRRESSDLRCWASVQSVEQQSCTDSVSLDSLQPPRAARPRTNELIMRDARHHWRQMIRKLPTRHKKSIDPLMRKSTAQLLSSQSSLKRVVNSRFYELAVMVLVLLNTTFIGCQVQYAAVNEKSLPFQSYIEATFCIAFSVELLARMLPEGFRHFWASREWAWNLFDLVVVTMMLFEQVLFWVVQISNSTLSQMSAVRVLRVVRVVRVVRVIRVLKFFKELRMMLHSILGSFRSLMWAMLVLLMTFYIFGISLTQGVVDYCRENPKCAESAPELLRYFGTLSKSVLTLYESMSGGISWADLVFVLDVLPIFYTTLFLVFIFFTVFAVVNIITGVFVDTAMQQSQQDRESLIQDEMHSKESYVESMHKVFEEIDADGSGTISIEEFKGAIEDSRMVAYFNALGLEITDVQSLFLMLDRDQTGSIDVDEFLLGCMRLKGEARSLDLAKLLYETDWLVHNFETMLDIIKDLPFSIATVNSELHVGRRITNSAVL